MIYVADMVAVPHKVIMDVDTGIDDAIALIVALQSPAIQIIGITCVSGNVSSRAAARNTLRILKRIGRKIPVMQGASRPLSKEWVHAKHIHGKGGLGDVQLEYDESLLRRGDATRFISAIMGNYKKREVSLIATGPLTNIAKAIIDDASIAASLARMYIMGGAYGLASDLHGNITRYAEFNFYCDPAAAQIVMDSGARMDVVGLDATSSRYIVDDRFIARLQSRKKASRLAKSLLQYPMSKFGKFDLPDVFAVAMLERPGMFKFKRGRIEVVQKGRLSGHSRFVQASGRTRVVSSVNEKRFEDYLFSRLGSKRKD